MVEIKVTNSINNSEATICKVNGWYYTVGRDFSDEVKFMRVCKEDLFETFYKWCNPTPPTEKNLKFVEENKNELLKYVKESEEFYNKNNTAPEPEENLENI